MLQHSENGQEGGDPKRIGLDPKVLPPPLSRAFVENALQEVMLELQHPGGMPQQIIFSETFLINVGRFAFFVAAFIT